MNIYKFELYESNKIYIHHGCNKKKLYDIWNKTITKNKDINIKTGSYNAKLFDNDNKLILKNINTGFRYEIHIGNRKKDINECISQINIALALLRLKEEEIDEVLGIFNEKSETITQLRLRITKEIENIEKIINA